MTHDLVIRGGELIDGTNRPGRRADVAVSAGRITEIGSVSGTGREEIDARGLVVAPGFIDSHTHDDIAVLVEPDMHFKISQGVTTCICGNCGVSAAPLPDGRLPEPLDLVSLAKVGRFHRTEDYLDAVRDTPCAVNTVPLLGHSSLRAVTMDNLARAASDIEMAAMRTLLERALSQGYFGVSTGTYYASAEHATLDEIIAVCEPLKRLGGVFATHMRNEADGVLESIDDTARIGRALGRTAIVSHHKVAGVPNHGRSVQTLSRLDALRREQSLGLDAYPYNASSTVLRADRARLAEKTLVTFSKPYPQYAGRLLSEIAAELGTSEDEACKRLAPAGATYFIMSEADVERILAYEGTMIGSDGIPLQAKPHPRLWGTFPRVLGHYCRDRRLFALHTAVYKMTGLTASQFGITDRGIIAPGKAADITVFDADTVIDRATFEAPTEPSAGIHCVIVNGRVGWRGGKVAQRAGQLLSRSAAPDQNAP